MSLVIDKPLVGQLKLVMNTCNVKASWASLETDLCTIQDVKDVLIIYPDSPDHLIGKLIRRYSEWIKMNAEETGLTSENHYAKYACIFGVISELGRVGYVEVNENAVKSFSDGDFRVDFDSTRLSPNILSNPLKAYDYCLSMLLGLPTDVLVLEDDY